MSISLLVILTTTAVNIGLGFFIFARNTRARANKAFLWLSFAMVLWMVCSYQTDNFPSFSGKLFFGKAAFAAGLLIIIAIINLAKSFPSAKVYRPMDWTVVGLLIGVSALSFSNLVVDTVKPSDSGVTTVVPGPVYSVYLAVLVLGFLWSAIIFSRQYRSVDRVGQSQIKLMLAGLGIGLGWGVITNAVLPITNPGLDATNYGPFSTVILAAVTGYAIARHKLFDLRLVVARTIVYALSVLVLAGGYALVTFVILGTLLTSFTVTNTARDVIYTTLAVFSSLTFPYVKRFFDRITSALFFQDAYETQSVLDRLGAVIVGTIDVAKLQSASLDILASAVRPDYMRFVVVDNHAIRLNYHVGTAWKPSNEVELADILTKVKRDVIVTDELEQPSSRLKTILTSEGISLIAPLTTKNEVVAHLIVGPKKSGNIYNAQDVGLLNIAANELAVALQNAQRFEEIQAFNITLQEKVNEATRELKSTNKKLVALDEAKDEFISMASHQLRTPLTSIKGYLSMILDGDMGKLNKNQQSALKEAFGSSQRMVFLISDFLNVSRIKTGKFVIEPVEVNLTTMITEELNQLKELAESRDVTLKYEQPEEFPVVKLDDNKIRQVMMNMVDNAIYYTPAGGTVTIELMSDGKEITFKVIDTGIGVPKAEKHKLFTKFFRAGNARVARPDGTGLGLFMAQKIIVAQKGSIIFESEEGKGSTFGFRFPLKDIKP